ncbi:MULTISPECIES: ATP-grasp domain-containing protein [unclassified Streptomyces]|uniref:ATP-grasp domain-containing protein n=1 Tax=unclassified Streptomyces TaxID=2593676 RepID=UPI0029BC7869|nr:ATP-grasp domain-containing protein [Streptomyces sp. DK15]MDX2395111.1 ATP-grasp domain-containing protein [Streptomyces sp. DK15]
MTSSPHLVVVYDRGAANVSEIAKALTKVAPLVFVTKQGSEHAELLLPLLRDMGEVVTFQNTPEEVVGRLRTISLGGITTFSEAMLLETAELAAELGLPYHSRHTARLLTDKFLQRQRLNETGTGSVAGWLLTRPEDWPEALRHVNLPVIVKPLRGEGSRNTHRVDSFEEGLRLVTQLLAVEPALVVEHFLTGRPCHPYGDYVSVESITCRGVISHIAVTGKFPLIPPFRETGQFWPAPLSNEEQQSLRDLAGAAIRSLGITTGITHTEIKLTGSGPRVIEVNGRLGGNINELSIRAAGLDMVELAGRVALGEVVETDPVTQGRVVFQYSNPAPPYPCRLSSVSGQRQLRNTEGITGYRVWIRPGTPINGGVSTHELDLILGEAEDHAGVMELLSEALGLLTFTFTSTVSESSVEISALELPTVGGSLNTKWH